MSEPISPAPFDRDLLDRQRRRWLQGERDEGAGFLMKAVAAELSERLAVVERRFEVAVDLGGFFGEMAAYMRAGGHCDRVVRIERLAFLLKDEPLAVVADEEFLPLAPDSVDLVVSALSMQFVNDVPGMLAQLRRALRPDGLFLAAFLGGETLNELRTALLHAESEVFGGVSPRVGPFTEIREAGALLQRSGFALPVTDFDRLTVRYDNLFALARDLRAMGAANVLTERSRRPATRRFFLRAAEIYAERFADPDGRIRASFDVIYLSGWSPHESQQKPLRPGSGKTSLAAALKDRSEDLS
ncbi:methyltransferase domain-containing protein [Jiella endophytica]|uniref:Methyltransferase domain-containing protein n=1 Tax=Jiella endophytica TaxID=2558362 RepID=A0A4Y8R9M1_9HYPH|nr:methyltransferase domain-containing protein [Jiella endophytica]TFF18240.1 methyltransferase domain-containing protein [Jiella endophytica]